MKSSKKLASIEARWALQLPNRFGEFIARVADATHAKLDTVERFELPAAPLEPSEIVDAADVAADWGIPDRLVPIIGDFHDLVCLDYRAGMPPKVIVLNDKREETFLFETFDRFLDALVSEPEEPSDLSRIVRSRLDF